tara:strand:+ start:98 stop:247 length:150 start_codon:yes stop_codon:yes gene_type:complete
LFVLKAFLDRAERRDCISELLKNEEILKKNIGKNETGLINMFQIVSFIL